MNFLVSGESVNRGYDFSVATWVGKFMHGNEHTLVKFHPYKYQVLTKRVDDGGNTAKIDQVYPLVFHGIHQMDLLLASNWLLSSRSITSAVSLSWELLDMEDSVVVHSQYQLLPLIDWVHHLMSPYLCGKEIGLPLVEVKEQHLRNSIMRTQKWSVF